MSFPVITKFIGSLFLITLLSASPRIYSQARAQKGNNNPWESLLSKLKSGKIADTVYLKQIDSLVVSSPVILGDKNLKSKLSTYKEIALSDNNFHLYRVSYYDYLSDNAFINNLAGVCIYYAEKKEDELKKVKPYINSLSLLRRQYTIYNRITGGNKFSGVKSYYEFLPFFEWLPEGIRKDSVPVATIKNAFLIMQAQASIFAFHGDTATATKVRKLADRILEATLSKFSKDKDLSERVTAYYYIIREFEMRCRNKYEEAIFFIMKAKQITNQKNDRVQLWKIGFKNNILLHLVDIYLDYKKVDSASKYLDSLKDFETKIVPGIRDPSDILKFTGRLMALKGDYKAAYKASLQSSEVKDSVFAVRTVDINNNLYAQAQAENTRDELDKTQAQKRTLYISIVFIVFLLIASVSLLTYKIRQKEKEIRQRIHDLNTASEIQIEELKEENRVVKMEEQKRLGLELHDDLAGNIAFIKTKVESEIIEAKDNNLKKRLSDLSEQISEVYEKTRNKSHKWHYEAIAETEESFKKRIQSLMDNGLPDKHFKKDIVIEENALKDINTRTKIEIVYILQEAITNILKHAKAHQVNVLIYRDISGLVLQVIDDGIGFDTSNTKRGLGLSSINKRVADLEGKIDIHSGKNGTEIHVTMPV